MGVRISLLKSPFNNIDGAHSFLIYTNSFEKI